MKKLTCLFLANLFFFFSFSEDYKTGTRHKDGYTSIYNTFYKPAATTWGSPTSVTRYGLKEEKTQKVVLPPKYKTVYTSYEEGLYIVEDTLEKWGLFSAKEMKFLVAPAYSKIEPFSEGVAVVQKKKDGTAYEYIYGAIDKSGKIIIPVEYSYLGNLRDGLMNFKSDDKKFGFINLQNKVVIPAMYKSMSTFSNGLAPACLVDSFRYGYINKENKFVIPPKYVDAETFYEGYAEVVVSKGNYKSKDKDLSMLIDTKGNEITSTPYEYISLRKEGGIFAVKKDEKFGMMDSTGKLLLPLEYKDIREFYEGMAVVEKESGIYGMINRKGELVLKPEYTYISGYSWGTVVVKKNGMYSLLDKNIKPIIAPDSAKNVVLGKKGVLFTFDDKVKLYDLSGKLLRSVNQEKVDIYGTNFYSDYDSIRVPYFKSIVLHNLQAKTKKKLIYSDVSDFNEEGIFIGKDGNYVFADHTGKQLFPKSFKNAVNFSEGICALQETQYSTPYIADKNLAKIADLSTVFYGPYSEGLALSKGQYGGSVYYLDKTGKTVFMKYAAEGYPCKKGRILLMDSNKKYYYVDKGGKEISTMTFDILGGFSEGLAGFKLNGKCGYIDSTGKMIINPQFDEAGSFTDGVSMVKSGSNYFQIDKKGNAVTQDKFTGASDPANGTFPAKKASGFGLVDSKGKTLIDFKYEQVVAMSEGMVWAKKNGKWGLLNAAGKELTPFEYDGGSSFENGYSKVVQNDKWGLMDKSGKLVLPIEYANMSTVYKNSILVVKPAGTNVYSVK